MELVSKINSAGDSGWIVDEEEFDLLDDLRLVSSFKRRRIASENFGLNSCSAMFSKKTINRNDEALGKVAAVAPDYEKFWDDMVQSVEGEFDFASDLKLNRQFKRRSIACENLWLSSFSNEGSRKAIKNSKAVTVDSDYGEFLNYTVQCFDVDKDNNDEWCVANVNDDDEDHVSEVLDAQYIMFLENLKEDGKSYMLKHTLSNGTSAVVKYEEENDLDTGLGMGNLETMKDCHNIENIKTENFLGSQLEREKIESPRRILRSNLGKKMNESSRKVVLRSNSVTKKTKSSKTVLRNSSRWRKTARATKTLKSGSIREDNESSSLKEALKRENAESLATLRSNPCGENGKSPSILNDAVKREKTERLGTLSNPRGENNQSSTIMNDAVKRETTESLETLKSNPQGENSKRPTVLNDPVKREKTPCNTTLRNGSRRESMGTERKLRYAHSIDKKSPLVEKNLQTETKSPVFFPATGCSIKRHSLEGIHLAKQRFNHGIKSEFDDEGYQIHLNFVKKDDRCLVHAPEGGKKMVHFGDDESDSEVFVLDNPFFTGTPFVSATSRLYDVEDGEGCTDNNESQFRDGLLEILQKPYDFTEYARLQIDSRPYLRKHDDLAEVIRQARRDRRKILNLFRGFFYWLQYMHSEGTFMPWLDSQIVSILPPDNY